MTTVLPREMEAQNRGRVAPLCERSGSVDNMEEIANSQSRHTFFVRLRGGGGTCRMRR